MVRKLKPEELRLTFDPLSLHVQTTEDLKPLDGIIGQQRAVSALRFGLSIHEFGFNIYVAGPRGIGKMTAVESFLEEFAKSKSTPPDWCYIYNFEDPYQPKSIRLPAGRGRELQQDMKNFVEYIRREIPKSFESDEYTRKRDEILNSLNSKREEILREFSAKAGKEGFTMHSTSFGVMLVPLKDGKPMSEADWNEIPENDREARIKRREALHEDMQEAIKQSRVIERTTTQSLQELDQKVVMYLIGATVAELKEKHKDSPDVVKFFEDIQNDLINNIELFKMDQTANPKLKEMVIQNYQINLLVDNSKTSGAPVVVEINPTYNNLFGRVEKEVQHGTLYTDFTMIEEGSLHRANGGYLVLPADDVLRNFMSWDGLKRALKSRSIQIEEMMESLGYTVSKTVRPQPIPLDIKVVMVGRGLFYYLLHSYDDDFPELFKVKADFDTRMEKNENNVHEFLKFFSNFCTKEKLKHLDGSSAAKLLEHACRLADDQEKLSTHFGAMADVIREAHYWAAQENAEQISERHVKKALDEKIYRSNLYQEHFHEMIVRNILLIDTDSKVVGQVNGLSVIQLGDYEFGKPSRITASVAPGHEGILDIERMVELGGPIHSKGVMILGGYLSKMFAMNKPLTLSARLVFEQSYEGVEGDSASSTELYAILSALSGLPLRQGIAVTGSVNQNGEVQAIGGVNEKIEGFFDICRHKKLTGNQGVIIPQSNVTHLMIRDDVVEAVRNKAFNIWAVSTIDEGIEVLTGVAAGARTRGAYPKDSVNYLVEKRLTEFAESLKKFGKPDPKDPTHRKSRSKKASK